MDIYVYIEPVDYHNNRTIGNRKKKSDKSDKSDNMDN